MDRLILIHLGIFLIVVGFFLVSFGVISYGIQNKEKIENRDENRVAFSGIIMIGPIPIVVGNSPTLAILSILTTILMLLWVYLFYMRVY
ncbi:MAG TPA: TIGR00304 family protein [Methanococcaceae archaeon]|uniref:TIGR00304 family protein n=1 Tax=Methanothermococcus okinawensis TaxID=155863 RepID=A0A832ZJZ5_9EURY|nr:TIGR00304 family protein [Methanococcaceae archaeon]HIP91278.1 TIGR00304 family protein [Methanothermococcus okinawensis]